jgi:hypothetical protein
MSKTIDFLVVSNFTFLFEVDFEHYEQRCCRSDIMKTVNCLSTGLCHLGQLDSQ